MDQIGRATGDNFFVTYDLLLEFRVNGARCLAVLAGNHVLKLLGNHLVALAGNDIEHGLRTHDLRGGGHQRRITAVFTHARYFGQHFLQFVLLAGLF